MEAGHQFRGEESETRLVEGEATMDACVQTIQNTYDEQITKGWTSDQIKIILVMSDISDKEDNVYRLRASLENNNSKWLCGRVLSVATKKLCLRILSRTELFS
jgi:hypothetical protein